MSSNWPTVKLGDFCKKIGSGATPRGGASVYMDDGEICLIRSQNVHNEGFNPNGLVYIDEDAAKKLSNVIVEENDVLLNITGDSVARVCLAKSRFLPARVNQHVAIIRPDEDEFDPRFIRYLLASPTYQNILLSIAAVGATRNALTKGMIENLDVLKPPIEQQIEMANQLEALDKKIDINSETNQTLEQIAQAIFKSWFVDFDPVKAKIEALAASGNADDAELAAMRVISAKTVDELNSLKASNPEAFNKLAQTAALFPAAMQDSELGEIPEGWSYCTFGDISACFDSKRVPLSKRKREEKQPGTIPYYGATSVMDYVNEWIFDDTYLLLGEDGSVVKDDGTPFVQYIWGKSWVNNHAHVLQGNNGVSTEHLMVFIKGTNIASYVTGAVQLKLNQKNMNSIPFLKASTEINLVFQGVLNGLYDAYKNNIESSQSLSSLRDSLLPRLLSGEMDLKDKE
ncbi:restriction endonuclease subunit S [Vibrio cholerae]|nr:restriction endonuclease subunit S [Vibrio cholerae]